MKAAVTTNIIETAAWAFTYRGYVEIEKIKIY